MSQMNQSNHAAHRINTDAVFMVAAILALTLLVVGGEIYVRRQTAVVVKSSYHLDYCEHLHRLHYQHQQLPIGLMNWKQIMA